MTTTASDLSSSHPRSSVSSSTGTLTQAHESSTPPVWDPVIDEVGLPRDPNNLYTQTVSGMLRAANYCDLKHRVRIILAQPKNEIMVHFPVRMDDGHHRLFKGYRVQHNNALGPYKGGLRFHPNVHLDDVKSLAFLMTIKCSLARLPLGGGKGGVKCDPRELSPGELERVSRRFTAAIQNDIGPDYDIPAPDMGTNAQVMAWIADTYMSTEGVRSGNEGMRIVTGKPVDFGGSLGREKATGQGVVDVIVEMLPDLGLTMEGMRVSVLGFGNVGSWAGRILTKLGAKVVAVMDHTGAMRNDEGFDCEALAEHTAATGGIVGFGENGATGSGSRSNAGGEAISEDEFYETPCEVFIPAAMEGMITAERAGQLSCRVVAEAANAPTTPEGEQVLQSRGIDIIPDMLCNSGGVTVSYFEWVQNKQNMSWTEEQVDSELNRVMCMAARRTILSRQRYEVDLRTAAYIASIDHIGNVYRTRGIFP